MMSSVAGLPDLQGRLDGPRKVSYLTSGEASKTIEYIKWEAGDGNDKKSLAISFPPLKNVRRSPQPTVVNANGIPFVVSPGEPLAEVKRRLGKPDVELKELGDTHLLYSSHAILLKVEKGKSVIHSATTNDPRYVTENGLCVGDPFTRVPQKTGSFSASTGEVGLPPLSGASDSGIWYLTSSSDPAKARIEYLRWIKW